MARKTIYRKNSSNGLDNTDLVIPTSSDLNKLDSIEYGAQKNPTLATVATSGSYNDLSNKPDLDAKADNHRHFKSGDSQRNAGVYTYYKLASFPIDNDWNSCSLTVDGRIGGWNNGNKGYLSMIISNRDGVAASGTLIGNADLSLCDLVVYTSGTASANSTAILYVKTYSWFAFDLTLGPMSGATDIWDGQEIKTTPAGTPTWTLSGDASKFLRIRDNGDINAGADLAVNKNLAVGGTVTVGGKQLAKVATTNSYNDLDNKPSINNGKLTILKNDRYVASFTADSSSDVTANITVPTRVGELKNDLGYITGLNIMTYSLAQDISDKHTLVFTEIGNDTTKVKKFVIPDTNTTYTAGTGLTLDGTTFSVNTGFTSNGKNYAVQADNEGNLYVNVPWTDTNTYPTKVSELENDSGYITSYVDTTYSAGTGLNLDGTTFSVKTGFVPSGKNYAVQADNEGNLYVNVPWTDTNSGGTVTSVSIKLNGIVQGTITHSGTINLGYIGTGNVESKGTQGSDATVNGEQGYYWLKDSSNMWLEIAYGCVSTSGDNSYTYVTFSKTFDRVPAVVMTMLDSRSTQTINYRNGQAINGTPTKYGFFFDAGNSENHKYAWIAIAVY